jgi:phage terminase large subunit GpA-like protein
MGVRVDNLADLEKVITGAFEAWRPPPRLSLSEWADSYFFLSAESAAEAGRWKTLPYQRGIMDAITDPAVEQVSLLKSARIGYTKILNATVGYYIHQNPSSILVVQPTVEDAKGYSKEEIAPMLRDCPVLAGLVFDDPEAATGPKDTGNTILHKKFPGGVLSMVGANSGTGFRRISRKVIIFDEVDGYPPSAGSEGDQIKLGIRRSEAFWDRKIIAGSTPLVAGRSRIEALFEAGDRRRFFVPCPQCGHKAPLVFSGDGGHEMKWPKDAPEEAFFSCQANGCVIEHKDKRAIVAAGEWRSSAPFRGHASFHVWAAYSYNANTTWGHIAREFLEAKDNPETLKTFVNTVLGETWKDKGDAPDWERIYNRRESYTIGEVPAGVRFLTCGVDVQKDRWVYEVVGWGDGKESWSIDSGVIPGDTSNEADWLKLDELLDRQYRAATGLVLSVACMAVDSGFNTQMVYNWARRHPMSRVMAIKGSSTARTLLNSPTPVDVNHRGKRIARGYKVWPIGVDIAKAELYGLLRLPLPEEGKPYPPGFCHFPEYGENYFKQLTSEQLVAHVNERTRFTSYEWQIIPGRENHFLDARVYARASAAMLGVDRMRPATPAAPPPEPTPREAPPVVAPPAPRKSPKRSDSRFLQAGGRAKGWLR